MKKDSKSHPWFPVTYTADNKHTGNVWSWIFWWTRNGIDYVASKTSSLRKRMNTIRHSVKEEIDWEAALLPW